MKFVTPAQLDKMTGLMERAVGANPAELSALVEETRSEVFMIRTGVDQPKGCTQANVCWASNRLGQRGSDIVDAAWSKCEAADKHLEGVLASYGNTKTAKLVADERTPGTALHRAYEGRGKARAELVASKKVEAHLRALGSIGDRVSRQENVPVAKIAQTLSLLEKAEKAGPAALERMVAEAEADEKREFIASVAQTTVKALATTTAKALEVCDGSQAMKGTARGDLIVASLALAAELSQTPADTRAVATRLRKVIAQEKGKLSPWQLSSLNVQLKALTSMSPAPGRN